MMDVKLFTEAGAFVADAQLPPFLTPPKVVLWGQRVFVRNDVGDGYYEAFSYALPVNPPTPSPLIPDGATRLTCPRRSEHGSGKQNEDFWRPDGTCSFCGSMQPDAMFKAVEDGVEVSTTDKNYKLYVGDRKFYFQHLSVDERRRFVELINAKKFNFAGGVGFYVNPFFVVNVTSAQ